MSAKDDAPAIRGRVDTLEIPRETDLRFDIAPEANRAVDFSRLPPPRLPSDSFRCLPLTTASVPKAFKTLNGGVCLLAEMHTVLSAPEWIDIRCELPSLGRETIHLAKEAAQAALIQPLIDLGFRDHRCGRL